MNFAKPARSIQPQPLHMAGLRFIPASAFTMNLTNGRQVFIALLTVFSFLFKGEIQAQDPNALIKFQREIIDRNGEVFVLEGIRKLDGEVIIPAEYLYIWDFGRDTITLARKREWIDALKVDAIRYQLVTKGGYLLLEFPFHLIPEPPANQRIRVYDTRLDRFGFLSLQGDRAVKFNFIQARDFSEDKAAVKDGKSQLWGFIHPDGKWAIQPRFDEAFSFSNGKAVVKLNNRFAYCNHDGTIQSIEGNYEQVFDLREGFSVVSNEKGFGFVNSDGKEIVSPQYDFLDNFENGIAVFLKGNEAGIIDNTGKIRIQPRYEEIYRFDERHYLFQQNGLKGLITLDGETVIPPNYSEIGLFYEGLAPVMRSGKWGFVDSKGNEIIPCTFAEIAGPFVNGTTQVRLNNRWQIAHKSDTLELPAYDEVLPFYGYTAAFRKGDLWGFLNIEGEESIEPQFDELVFNQGGLVYGRVPQADGSVRFALVNSRGKEITEAKYTDVVRFCEGFSAVKTNAGWGFIDINGIEIIRPQYDEVRNFSSGRAAVKRNGEWGFVSPNGAEVIPMFTRMPDLKSEDGSLPKTAADSLSRIRESFPLFLMEVVGDFNGSLAFVEDLTRDNDSGRPLLINKVGKIIPGDNTVAEPIQRNADIFVPESEINPAYLIVRIPGRWITIDTEGRTIE
jgi:hypothetical protein